MNAIGTFLEAGAQVRAVTTDLAAARAVVPEPFGGLLGKIGLQHEQRANALVRTHLTRADQQLTKALETFDQAAAQYPPAARQGIADARTAVVDVQTKIRNLAAAKDSWASNVQAQTRGAYSMLGRHDRTLSGDVQRAADSASLAPLWAPGVDQFTTARELVGAITSKPVAQIDAGDRGLLRTIANVIDPPSQLQAERRMPNVNLLDESRFGSGIQSLRNWADHPREVGPDFSPNSSPHRPTRAVG